MNDDYPAPLRLAHKAVWYSYAALLGLFSVDAIAMLAAGAPLTVALVLWLLRALPLLLFIPALRRQSPRGAAWMCFVLLLYFTHAVVTAFIPGELLYGLVYTTLCVVMFGALVAWIRMLRTHRGLSVLRD